MLLFWNHFLTQKISTSIKTSSLFLITAIFTSFKLNVVWQKRLTEKVQSLGQRVLSIIVSCLDRLLTRHTRKTVCLKNLMFPFRLSFLDYLLACCTCIALKYGVMFTITIFIACLLNQAGSYSIQRGLNCKRDQSPFLPLYLQLREKNLRCILK
jgi:hypothetical protein